MTQRADEVDVRELVERLLRAAVERRASDLHVDAEAGGYCVRLRVDGLLETVQRLEQTVGRAVVTRLMVLSQLLTYRLDIPQEGRLTPGSAVTGSTGDVDMRVAVMPTVHGLRAVVRMPAELHQPRGLEQLRLPTGVLEELKRFARSDSGMLLVTGPAGAGKTTTMYAVLEHIAATQQGISIVTLEDPVERKLPGGVTQIEVTPHGELTYERALRSIVRQDPQVLMLGEIRDAATASVAVQAALAGHRLMATLHAGSPQTAIARLMEMGVEPYQVTSAVSVVVTQRLVRRKSGEGYAGRAVLAEAAVMDERLRAAVLARGDAAGVRGAIEKRAGFESLHDAAERAVREGVTDEQEIRRVMGPPEAGGRVH
jgi:general secretion pathway protein E